MVTGRPQVENVYPAGSRFETGGDQVIVDVLGGRVISRLRMGVGRKLLPSSLHFLIEEILNWLGLNYFPNDTESKETLSEQIVRILLP